MIMSADHPELTFSLHLIRSEPTYNQPVQQWSFVSDFAVRDYSGTYTIKLLPCTTLLHQKYHLPVTCNPREPVTFDLDIRFQQDKAQPETQATSFGNILFNAKLAADDPEATLLVNQPGSDGFKVDSTPLFQVALGREWYIHTIYTVRSKDNSNRGIGKRSVEYQYHSIVSPGKPQPTTKSRKKRKIRSTPPLVWAIGAKNSRGTNIQHISLDRTNKQQDPKGRVPPDSILPWERNSPISEVSLVMVMGGIAVGLLTLGLIAIAAVICKSKRSARRKDAPKGSGSSEPMMSPHSYHSDSSEV
ncbi:FRAS1-related extracellular matrix protein 2 [Myotis brandtii]|uniref:FRAS1-related extracellular matrix protein 2 n=1 Tax=Myotis brandtii TaxID=109478 RepID=S7MMY9_MYOBR|nr:FRAS1-related extracellular matrix protein 2 [Myotis brandtii]